MLAQLSDPHVQVGPRDAGSARALAAAVEAVASLDPAPEAVLVSGDIAANGAPDEYERVAELLAPLPMPVHAMVGNHDDRDALRAVLGGPDGDFVQYAAAFGGVRLVVCDTIEPGRDDGRLGPERLGWLDAQLAIEPQAPTVVAMHHPPLATGIRAIDDIGLAVADRAAVAELVERHPQVRRVVGGHIHRAIVGSLGRCDVFVCPSTWLQLRLDFADGEQIAFVREPAAFAVHVELDGELVSHVLPVGDYEPPA
jgi:3',5'-cyclic-AMP phosphodiesterase